MKIEGVPDGWELVRIAKPKKGEYFLDEYNMPVPSGTDYFLHPKPIVCKVERPKQYRPFASAEEFKPHRDRWVRFYESCLTKRIGAYSETEVEIIGEGNWGYDAAFASYVFDDGSPFGVEVSE